LDSKPLQSYGDLDAYLDAYCAHEVIDHATAYVDGKIHTNGLENFWSLLKRGISGTYVSVEPFHLFRYLDEQSFRYNNRSLGQHHLKILSEAGLIACRREGQFVYNQAVPETILAYSRALAKIAGGKKAARRR
jgi:hypothetical protein